VTMITRIPSLMVVPPSSPARTVMEFVALAKSMPGKLNYGSGGAGSLAHLSGEAFRLAAVIDYLHVPYKMGRPINKRDCSNKNHGEVHGSRSPGAMKRGS